MLRGLSASYAGHIVDDSLGFQGTPANDRWYPNGKLAETFEWAVDFAQLLDTLGYDECWMAEHHCPPEGYACIPHLLMLNVYLATKTARLQFGCGFNITPMWHPLRLAEDFAMADILTQGRVIFGGGRGYHTREVETLGAPMRDANANRALFEEQSEVLLKAFHEESFAHDGTYSHLPPRVPSRGYPLATLTLVPRPLRRPVALWQPLVSGPQRGIDFMARMGIKALVANTPEPTVGERLGLYQAAAAAHGRELPWGEEPAIGYRFFIADTQQKAIEQARPYCEEAMKCAAPWGLMRLSPAQIAAVADPQRHAGLEAAVANKIWLCGPAEQIVDHLRGVEEQYPGLPRINLGAVMGMPREVLKDQLTKCAEGVMPHVAGRSIGS